MVANSKIEWTDHTFNPWVGCTKVSPACDGCYAENLIANRFGRAQWGAGEARERTSKANWRKPIAWDRQATATGKRPLVFCASLADVFDNEVDPAWRADLMDLIEATPNLIWLLLTKRIGNVRKMTAGRLPGNAAIGATIANQEEYNRDAVKLAEVRAALRPLFSFGSFEPLLGPIALNDLAPDWIIVGGETSQGAHRARLMPSEWPRAMRERAAHLNRAFFMKQMTDKHPIPLDLLVREYPVECQR